VREGLVAIAETQRDGSTGAIEKAISEFEGRRAALLDAARTAVEASI
jgi:hypothetical protein